MSDSLLPQKTYSFNAAEIEKAPDEGGIFVIFSVTMVGRQYLVIEEASDLRQALLDVLPPLGPRVRLSRPLDQIDDQLFFAVRVVLDAKERKELAGLLISTFEPDSNRW